MIFEPKPKERRGDLFNFEEEVERIIRELHDPLTRLIVIKGPRRTGKSSILRVGLNESKLSYVLIDMREFEDVDRRSFSYELSEVLGEIIKCKRETILGRVKAVSFLGIRVELGREETTDPAFRYKAFLRGINRWAEKKNTYFVLAIDEAQEVAKINFDRYLAFVYDTLKRIKIVLTGSQIGVITNLLDNPKRPLFGRARIDINTRYLSEREAIEFLRAGFRENGLEIDENILRYVVKKLNGNAGWLTLFGWFVVKGQSVDEALDKVLELGANLVYEEFQKFLDTRGVGKRRYIEVAKILAEGPKRWKEVKTLLELRLKRRIPNNQLSKYLNELRKYGFIMKQENKYLIPDPILRYAVLTKF